MFGRSKSEEVATPTLETVTEPPRTGGKGRPTPKRREAEQRNRHPIVDGTALPANATKEQRKAAKEARRERMAQERALQRAALETGDETHLPPRDKGPARRWVRDYVDARRSVGEFLLPATFVALGMSLAPNASIKAASIVVLYLVLFAVVVDSFCCGVGSRKRPRPASATRRTAPPCTA